MLIKPATQLQSDPIAPSAARSRRSQEIENAQSQILAVALSMDAFAGFSLTLLDINAYPACALIGLKMLAI